MPNSNTIKDALIKNNAMIANELRTNFAKKSDLDYNNLSNTPDLTVYAKLNDDTQTITASAITVTPGASYIHTTYDSSSISMSIPRTPGYTLNIPTKNGTLATTGDIDSRKLINKTYAELQTMKTNGTLIAGQLYRITDYVTKTNGKCNNIADDARSMEHPFDIILRAISTDQFSEQARAIWHSGDNYFANSRLQAWKLWYCFDNDSNRFEWADTATGKGVIYRMIDEFGNDLPYDFKNIQFKRYKITGTSDQRQAAFVDKYLGFSGNYAVVSDSSDYVWYYTFSKRSDGSDLSLTETTESSIANSYYVKQVVIGQYLTDTPNYRGAQALNNIVVEANNIIVDVQIGAGSHHNTWVGNVDIDYCYFREMFRQNILFGEINHTRADEAFEKNVMGDGSYSTYASCWNKFSHHFSQNTSLNMQSNDFENQVSDCKFPAHFTRNHVSNMWDAVDASTHDTFNRCEFGYMVNVTLSGTGTWDGVESIMCYHVIVKVTNFFGSKLGRMEYVSISEGANSYNILNLSIGAIYGASNKVLTIDINDLSEIGTTYQKSIDFARNTATDGRCLIYTYSIYNASSNTFAEGGLFGTVANDGSVTWSSVTQTATNILTINVADQDVNGGYITAEEYNKINECTIIKLNYTGAPSVWATHVCYHYTSLLLGLAKVFVGVGEDSITLLSVSTSPETSGTYAGQYEWAKDTAVTNLKYAAKTNKDNEFDSSHKNTFKGETEFQDIMTVKSNIDLTTNGYITGGYILSSIPTVNYYASTQLDDIADAIWNAKKAYAVGDIIFYSRALYICEVAVSASNAGNTVPSSDPTHWTRLFQSTNA